jgi:hypothetical protein
VLLLIIEGFLSQRVQCKAALLENVGQLATTWIEERFPVSLILNRRSIPLKYPIIDLPMNRMDASCSQGKESIT